MHEDKESSCLAVWTVERNSDTVAVGGQNGGTGAFKGLTEKLRQTEPG